MFETSFSDIWQDKQVLNPRITQCRLSKITAVEGLLVVPYILNAKLGDEASFSHVIYNDRVLQRRSYIDGTEQQLFAHHFVHADVARKNGEQITSPTPLFSHCPIKGDNTYRQMHHFKVVDFEDIGKTRMYDRFHRFNQKIDLDADLNMLEVSNVPTSSSFWTIQPEESNLDFSNPWNLIYTANSFRGIYNYFYKNEGDSKISESGSNAIYLFFNTRFRWTRKSTSTASPDTSPLATFEHSCAYEQKRGSCSEFINPRVSATCENDNLSAPTFNPLGIRWGSQPIPTGNTRWDAHTLALFYEQDAYEAGTVRPWWSSTVCDMVQNFADRSTNYYFLDLLFTSMPQKMYDLIGDFVDDPGAGIHNVEKFRFNKDCMESKVDSDAADWVIKTGIPQEGQYYTAAWRRLVRFISKPKKLWENMLDSKKNGDEGRVFDRDHLDGYANAFTRLFGINMLRAREKRTGTQDDPTYLSFASCVWGEKKTGLNTRAKAYCNSMHQTTKRRITKPSLWSEIDGSPGKYLIACNKDWFATENQGCLPILVAATQNEGQGVTNWEKPAQESGACSYSVEFSGHHFCGPPEFGEDKKLKNCVSSSHAHDLHPFPVRGDYALDNVMWTCKQCRKFSSSEPILQNTIRREQSAHRVGCGIYRRDNGQNTEKMYTGPMTKRHDKYNLMIDTFEAGLDTLFDNVTAISQEITDRLLNDFGDKIYMRNNAIWWNITSQKTTVLSPKIRNAFQTFGSLLDAQNMGTAEGCEVDNLNPQIQEDCIFVQYDAATAFDNSLLYKKDLDNGCRASDDSQDHIEQGSCNPNITNPTLDRVKSFAENIQKNRFGLNLPVVPPQGRRTLRVQDDSKVSWSEGVLPFFAANRRSTVSKDSDFLGHLLDMETRCADSYKGQPLSQFACFLDENALVQVVVPWLGKDYAFLKPESRNKIYEYQGETGKAPEQDLSKVEMGTDTCQSLDSLSRLPCTATACIENQYPVYENKTSFCLYSQDADAYYRREIPKSIDRLHVQQLHLDHNLFNPRATHSQCYIKYTPVKAELQRGRQCMHMQAPLGYSPASVRLSATTASSLKRSNVHIDPRRWVRDEFRTQTLRYSSLWAGDAIQQASSQTLSSVSCIHYPWIYRLNKLVLR